MTYATRTTRLAMLGAAALLLPLPLAAQASGQPSNKPARSPKASVAHTVPSSDVATWGVRPGEESWVDVPDMPGAMMLSLTAGPAGPYAVRLRFPDGYEIRSHAHGARLMVTVLEGTYRLGFGKTVDETQTVDFPAGSYIIVPANIPHFAWTEGETVLQVVSERPIKLDWGAGTM